MREREIYYRVDEAGWDVPGGTETVADVRMACADALKRRGLTAWDMGDAIHAHVQEANARRARR